MKMHLTAVDSVSPKRWILILSTAFLKAYKVVNKYRGKRGKPQLQLQWLPIVSTHWKPLSPSPNWSSARSLLNPESFLHWQTETEVCQEERSDGKTETEGLAVPHTHYMCIYISVTFSVTGGESAPCSHTILVIAWNLTHFQSDLISRDITWCSFPALGCKMTTARTTKQQGRLWRKRWESNTKA